MNVSRFSSADLYCLTVTLIWGANMSLTKDALSEFSPMGFNGLRMLLAGLLLLTTTVVLAGKLRVDPADLKKIILLGILGNTVYQIFFIHGLHLTKAGNVGLLLTSGTVFTALLSHFLKHEALKRIVWVGIVFSLTGVLLILLESSELSFQGGTLKGDLMVLVAASCWSVYTVYSKPMMKTYSPLQLTSMTIFSGSVFFFLVSLPWVATEPYDSISLRSYMELGYSFIFSIALAYVFWFLAVDRIGSTRTAIYGNLVPFTALLFAALVLGEEITTFQLLGGALIFTGIYLTRLGRDPDAPAAIRQRQY